MLAKNHTPLLASIVQLPIFLRQRIAQITEFWQLFVCVDRTTNWVHLKTFPKLTRPFKPAVLRSSKTPVSMYLRLIIKPNIETDCVPQNWSPDWDLLSSASRYNPFLSFKQKQSQCALSSLPSNVACPRQVLSVLCLRHYLPTVDNDKQK